VIDEVESDVVGGGLSEVPHHQLDDVPIGGMRLHEHRHLWPYLLALELAVLRELAVGPEQHDDAKY
jgi:hypothetical protein